MIIFINYVLVLVYALTLVLLLISAIEAYYDENKTTYRVLTTLSIGLALLPYAMVLVPRILRYWGITK